MGPRRKLSLAISEMKKQEEEDEGGGREGERGAEVGREKEGERRGESERGGDGGGREDRRTGKKTPRPPLIKQPSTELTAAYRQVRVCVSVCVCVLAHQSGQKLHSHKKFFIPNS